MHLLDCVLSAVIPIRVTGCSMSMNTYSPVCMPLVCGPFLCAVAHIVDTLQLTHSCSGPVLTTVTSHMLCSEAARSARNF